VHLLGSPELQSEGNALVFKGVDETQRQHECANLVGNITPSVSLDGTPEELGVRVDGPSRDKLGLRQIGDNYVQINQIVNVNLESHLSLECLTRQSPHVVPFVSPVSNIYYLRVSKDFPNQGGYLL
jgi:hypothetical protein